VLYTLLTGRPPYVGHTPREVLLAHLHQDPIPPSHFAPTPLPLELDQLVLRCLAKDPSIRPHSAASFFDELVYFLRVHASRVFRGSVPTPRFVPAHEPSEPVLTQIRVRMPTLDPAEEAPTAERARARARPRSYRRMYEDQLEVTKDVCLDDSMVEVDPEDFDTYPEPRREIRFVA
jgi:serine/threonine protein kinase